LGPKRMGRAILVMIGWLRGEPEYPVLNVPKPIIHLILLRRTT